MYNGSLPRVAFSVTLALALLCWSIVLLLSQLCCSHQLMSCCSGMSDVGLGHRDKLSSPSVQLPQVSQQTLLCRLQLQSREIFLMSERLISGRNGLSSKSEAVMKTCTWLPLGTMKSQTLCQKLLRSYACCSAATRCPASTDSEDFGWDLL